MSLAWMLPSISPLRGHGPTLPTSTSVAPVHHVGTLGAVGARRRARINMQSSPPTDNLHLLSASSLMDLPTPGETRELDLDFSLLTTILKANTKTFGLQPPSTDLITDMSSPGALLNILRINAVNQTSLSAAVQVHCPARLAVQAMQPIHDGSSVRIAKAVAMHDNAIESHAHRASLADTEWSLWQSARRAASLLRKLSGSDGAIVAQGLFVYSPREYDRQLSHEDWMRTPQRNRDVWARRAESFSFAVVRAFGGDEESFDKARKTRCTLERLDIGRNAVDDAIRYMTAQLSVEEALRES